MAHSEMDELIFLSIKGRTTPEQEEAIRAWRRESARNDAYFQQLVLLLEEAEAVMEEVVTPPRPPLTQILGRRDETDRSRRRSVRGRSPWVWGGFATAAAAAMLALVLVASPEREPPSTFSLQAGEFVTGVDETATTVLRDGTVVRLAPGSRLLIPGRTGVREVVLEGRAYFAVTELPGHPFRVLTRAGEAVVLGTRFEVRVQNEELRLIVLEGRVALDAGGRQVEVGAGEMSMVAGGTATTPVKVENLEPLMEWLKEFIVFQNTPLVEAARELERVYGVPVVVTDSLLGQETITGWYGGRTFEEILMIVCGVLQARCSIGNGAATISPHWTEGS